MSDLTISSAKVAAILALIQENPEIDTTDATWMTSTISRAARWIVRACHYKQYPELLQGYSKSGASPSTDVSAAASHHFYISVNGSPRYDCEPVLADMGSSSAIATELQRAIRAIDEDQYGFSEVTVTYASSVYTITSGKYGEKSTVQIGYDQETNDLCRLLKLTRDYGGMEYCGAHNDSEFDDMVIMLVEILYRKVGLEGLSEGAAPGGVQFQCWDTDPMIRRFIHNHRRLV